MNGGWQSHKIKNINRCRLKCRNKHACIVCQCSQICMYEIPYQHIKQNLSNSNRFKNLSKMTNMFMGITLMFVGYDQNHEASTWLVKNVILTAGRHVYTCPHLLDNCTQVVYSGARSCLVCPATNKLVSNKRVQVVTTLRHSVSNWRLNRKHQNTKILIAIPTLVVV